MSGLTDLSTVLYIRDYLDYIDHHDGMINAIDAQTIQTANREGLEVALNDLLESINSNPAVVQQVATLFSLPGSPTRIRARDLSGSVLTSRDSIRDLMAATQMVRASDLSSANKDTLSQILIIRDYLDYIDHHQEIVRSYQPEAMNTANQRGLEHAMLALLNRINRNRSLVTQIVEMFHLPAGTTRIRARDLSRLLLPQQDGIQDLVVALCTMDSARSFCPALTSVSFIDLTQGAGYDATGTETGEGVEFSIYGNNLPENSRVRFLIPVPNEGLAPGTTIYQLGTQRYISDPNIIIVNNDQGLTFHRAEAGQQDSVAMHLRVRREAALNTQRAILIQSTDFEQYQAYRLEGFNIVAAPTEVAPPPTATLPTPNVTGVNIDSVNRAPAGQPAEATPMTITVENIPEEFDLANMRVEFYRDGVLDNNIRVEGEIHRSGNEFEVQIRVPAVAELGARTIRVTLVDGDNETHGELANAFNVLEGNGERVEGEDSPAWASAGDFWTENAGNVYLRSNSGFTTFSFEGLTPRDEIVPSLQHLPDTTEAFNLSFAMGSESEPATLLGSNAALFYREGWPDVFSAMYWLQGDFSYYYHSNEDAETMSGRAQLGLLPRFHLGEQHRGILDFGAGYEYQEFDYFDTLNFHYFDGPRHTLSTQIGAGYQNDLLFFRMAFMHRLTSETQEIPGLPSFNGTTNMWGGRLDLDINFSRLDSRAPNLEIFFETMGGEAELPVYRNSQLTGARIDMRQMYRAGITLDWRENSYRPYVTGSFSYETNGDEEPTMGIVTRAGLYVGPERGGHFSRPYHIGGEFSWMQNQSVYYGGRQIYGGLFIETPYLIYMRLGVGNIQEPNGNSYTDFRMEVGIDLLQIIGLARDRAARRAARSHE